MHADLMLLYLLYLWIMISTKKAGQNCFQSHYHLLLGIILVYLNIIQSGQPSVDTFY